LLVSIGLTPIFAATPNDSIHFDDSDNANFILKGINTITSQDNPSYKLNGIGDYMILESNLPEKLKELSISVWVKPNFKVGAPATLSIISESNAFDLSINNDQIDKNFVTFSVYDGIKWHHITSKSEIKDNWTHLAATFSDETISIFVNGVKENYVNVDGRYSLTYTHGKAKQNSYDYLKSESKILVGAFTPLLRADGVVKNNFSGQIDDVMLYDTTLLPNQISMLYENDRISHKLTFQAIDTVSKKTGIVNQYGFITDPDNPDDQKIEALSSQGYKIKKLSSGNTQTIIFETSNNNSNVDSTKENIDSQTSEVAKPIVGSGITPTVCHVPSGDVDGAFTITIFASSVNIHLDHDDTLGECI
jgi:hypothetical protein